MRESLRKEEDPGPDSTLSGGEGGREGRAETPPRGKAACCCSPPPRSESAATARAAARGVLVAPE